MDHQRQPEQRGLLFVTRIAGDAERTRRIIVLLGVPHTAAAVRAFRHRAVLHRISEKAARPLARKIHDVARAAAQDPGVDGEGLRRSLERVMVLADRERALKIFDLARDELGATYSADFGAARM